MFCILISLMPAIALVWSLFFFFFFEWRSWCSVEGELVNTWRPPVVVLLSVSFWWYKDFRTTILYTYRGYSHELRAMHRSVPPLSSPVLQYVCVFTLHERFTVLRRHLSETESEEGTFTAAVVLPFTREK